MHRSLLESLAPHKPPLRIGLLLDSRKLTRFFAEIVRQIIESEFAALELLIFHAAPETEAGRLFSRYQKWDRENADLATDPMVETDCSGIFEGIHSLPSEAVEPIRAKQLDVIFHCGLGVVEGEIPDCARHGVWAYDFGSPDCFWEVYERDSLTFGRLMNASSGTVLAEGCYPTAPGVSQVKNRVSAYWGSSTFLVQKLRELHAGALVARGDGAAAQHHRMPTDFELVRWLGPALTKKVAGRIRRFNSQPVGAYWWLAFKLGGKPLEQVGAARGFQKLENPKGHFYADPFLFEDGGKLWLFFEDCLMRENRGTLACAEFDRKTGALGEVIRVLDKPYHLSYPCVFRDGDTIYMIPEAQANLTVDLYRAVDFPRRWELVKTLYEGSAVDTMVWKKEGVWYFFSTLRELRGEGVQLWLFTADSPLGEWRPHPASPISTDVRGSRNGGAIFERNGRLFRPSQNCSITYGHGFALNEILVLTPTEYEEKVCVEVEPDWTPGIDGTHSYAQFEDIEVIDALQLLRPDQVS